MPIYFNKFLPCLVMHVQGCKIPLGRTHWRVNFWFGRVEYLPSLHLRSSAFSDMLNAFYPLNKSNTTDRQSFSSYTGCLHLTVTTMHVDKHSILSDRQHGFRARRSCETQLVTLQHDLASTLDKGVQLDMVFLDFSKAINRVPHR